MRILLVDDETFNLILLENLIQMNFPNIKMETALNGKLAFDKVKAADTQGTPFDLVFMDINMPEMDGFQSSKLICSSFKMLKLKTKPYIAAITAYTSDEMKRKAYINGMDKFLTKPAQIQHVYTVIKRVLDRRFVTNTSQSKR